MREDLTVSIMYIKRHPSRHFRVKALATKHPKQQSAYNVSRRRDAHHFGFLAVLDCIGSVSFSMNRGIPSQVVLGFAPVEIDRRSTGAFEGDSQDLSKDYQKVQSQRSHTLILASVALATLLAASPVIFGVEMLAPANSEPSCDTIILSKLRPLLDVLV